MITTIDDLLDEVRKVAKDHPDQRGDQGPELICFYVKDGAPSCIVGHALWNLGLIDVEFEKDSSNELAITDLLGELDVDFGDSGVWPRAWLSTVQRNQDCGTPWAMAVQAADEVMPR